MIYKKHMICKEKQCRSCKQIKLAIEFHGKKCKSCKNIHQKSEHAKELARLNYQKNKNRICARKRKEYAQYIEKNPYIKIRKSISSAIYRALIENKGSKNGKSIFDFLPYSVKELQKYLESKWESWMNWENYGKFDINKRTWQIDHIIPQSILKFSSMKDENFKKCWSLENLRPLGAKENMEKSNKIIKELEC
jgi:hypothetical protein